MQNQSLFWFTPFTLKKNTLELQLQFTNLLPSKFFSAGEGEVGMRGFVHNQTSKRDRVLNGGKTRNGAASSFWTIHDASLHLHRSFFCQGRSTARIEQRIRFQFPHLSQTLLKSKKTKKKN